MFACFLFFLLGGGRVKLGQDQIQIKSGSLITFFISIVR